MKPFTVNVSYIARKIIGGNRFLIKLAGVDFAYFVNLHVYDI